MSATRSEQMSFADLASDSIAARIDFHVRASRRGAAKARMVKRLTLLRMTRG